MRPQIVGCSIMFADVNQATSSYHVINPGWPPACCYCLLIGMRGFILTLLTSRIESTFYSALTSGEHISDIWVHLPRGAAIRWLGSIFSYKLKAKIAAWSSLQLFFLPSFFFFFLPVPSISPGSETAWSHHTALLNMAAAVSFTWPTALSCSRNSTLAVG